MKSSVAALLCVNNNFDFYRTIIFLVAVNASALSV
jgi:hypothetical protein